MREEFLLLHEEAKKWQCLQWAFKLVPLRASSEEIIYVAEWLRSQK